MRSAAIIAFLAAVVVAQEKSAPLALDAVLVKPAELPKNVRIVEGIHTKEPHPRTFYETPTVKGIARILPPKMRAMISKEYMASFPIPKRKECQSFLAEGGAKGTGFVFEYETDDLAIVRSFLEPILWGKDGPSEDHPEEIVIHERILWILSFPRGDPACEWYKHRLRKKLRIPAPQVRPELDPLGARLAAILEKQDADAGLRFLAENAKVAGQWAFGQCMLGQFAAMKRDHALAEKGFRKALVLHESLTDPLDRNFVWVTLDGLGVALAGQGKGEEAARMFERAIAAGNELGDPWAATRSCYNIARVLAKMKQWGEARRALEQVISIDEEYKEIARRDPDLAEARKRKDFQGLLK